MAGPTSSASPMTSTCSPSSDLTPDLNRPWSSTMNTLGLVTPALALWPVMTPASTRPGSGDPDPAGVGLARLGLARLVLDWPRRGAAHGQGHLGALARHALDRRRTAAPSHPRLHGLGQPLSVIGNLGRVETATAVPDEHRHLGRLDLREQRNHLGA